MKESFGKAYLEGLSDESLKDFGRIRNSAGRSITAATQDRIIDILNHRAFVRRQVYELDVEARLEAAKTNSEVPGQLHVLVKQEGSQLTFFCHACKREHLHGLGLGHRVAHCTTSWSPYEGRGYILVELQ